jgi:hypothetical protein
MISFDSPHNSYKKFTDLPPDFTPLNAEKFDPEVWGPHYWFFIHTLSHTYPVTPTSVTKRKYYDFIQNLPLFIPNPEIGNKFATILDKYPVSPYLDSRDSFIRWTHFIHNKINVLLKKEEISLFNALDKYRAHYRPKEIKITERFRIQTHYVYFAFILTLMIAIFIFYK